MPSGATRGLILGDIDYRVVPGLSNEARSRLEAARPRTVGQAGRLDGLTPAALGILAAYLRREARRKDLSSATA
jgi:tRNA uridine 5-carboxymethylaminomethyl modification enzyme